MRRQAIERVLDDLKAGRTPCLAVEDVPAFGEGRPHLDESSLKAVADSLSAADAIVFERALRAVEEGEQAWLGFKWVYDAEAAVSNHDTAMTKAYGAVGSADARPLAFFCNDAKEVVCAREYSPRDLFQMKDVTRGPSMHTEQYPGLTWASCALFDPVRVWLLGASDVASYTADYARQVGFAVSVVDADPSFLTEERFPHAERILLEGDDFSGLSELRADPSDYVCVLTRGHMFDPESCIWALGHQVRYVGMMGCAGKNGTVYGIVKEAGITDEQWERVKRPIGLKFGAKTPAELAMSITAELVDVRYRDRYGIEAQKRHERSLGLA